MVFSLSITQRTTIVSADVLDTVNLILNEGDNYEPLVHFCWEGYVWNELIIRANEMIHRGRLILKKEYVVGFSIGRYWIELGLSRLNRSIRIGGLVEQWQLPTHREPIQS